jgi:hypothetical protein
MRAMGRKLQKLKTAMMLTRIHNDQSIVTSDPSSGTLHWLLDQLATFLCGYHFSFFLSVEVTSFSFQAK